MESDSKKSLALSAVGKPVSRIRKIQFAFGILLLIAFALTGQYLMRVFVPRHLGELHFRMMARADHIYILFLAMLNLMHARIESPSAPGWQAKMASVSRILLMGTGLFFLGRFFLPPTDPIFPRMGALAGMILTLICVLIAVAPYWKQAPSRKSP